MIVIGVARTRLEAQQESRRATRHRIDPKGLHGDSSCVDTALDERLPLDLWCLNVPDDSVRIHGGSCLCGIRKLRFRSPFADGDRAAQDPIETRVEPWLASDCLMILLPPHDLVATSAASPE